MMLFRFWWIIAFVGFVILPAVMVFIAWGVIQILICCKCLKWNQDGDELERFNPKAIIKKLKRKAQEYYSNKHS